MSLYRTLPFIKMIIIGLGLLAFHSAMARTPPIAQGEELGHRVQLHSDILQQDRQLRVLLPQNYHNQSDTNYPVIYLLDGDYTFHSISGMLDSLSNMSQIIPEVILVGIVDQGISQYRENMTPPFKSDAISSKAGDAKDPGGNADVFLRFLNHEVKPYIEKNYRTADHSTLIGQSMGGLFTLYSLFTAPDSFEHYIAISPSLWVNNHALSASALSWFKDKDFSKRSVYISLADESRMGVYGLLQILDEHGPAHLKWSFKHYPDENHNSIGMMAARDGLRNIFADWHLSEPRSETFASPAMIADQYQQLMKQYHLQQPIPNLAIKAMIRWFYRRDKAQQVAAFVEEVISKLPASEAQLRQMQAKYSAHFDSAEAALPILTQAKDKFKGSVDYLQAIAAIHKQLGQNKKARHYYQRALELARQRNSKPWQLTIIQAELQALEE